MSKHNELLRAAYGHPTSNAERYAVTEPLSHKIVAAVIGVALVVGFTYWVVALLTK